MHTGEVVVTTYAAARYADRVAAAAHPGRELVALLGASRPVRYVGRGRWVYLGPAPRYARLVVAHEPHARVVVTVLTENDNRWAVPERRAA